MREPGAGAASLAALRAQVQQAAARGTPLRIRGGGSKDWYGCAQAAPAEVLDLRPHAGVVDYAPSELVVTARAGTPLVEIEALLAAQGQMLGFEPPHFGAEATIGGCVAAGLSGPRRISAGAVRDFVLGAVLLDGRGDVLRFGGQVMKNVAGYDVARLLAGSLGALGVLLEVSLKTLPRPRAELTLRFELAQAGALEQLDAWAGTPVPMSASAWQDGVLHLRLSGAQAAVSQARARLGGEALDDAAAAAFWAGLREQRSAFFHDAPAGSTLWRLALPAATPPLLPERPMLVEWHGMQRWVHATPAQQLSAGERAARGAAIRAAALAAGGHATAFRGSPDPGDGGAFTPQGAAIMDIHRRLKSAFDPAGIFNRGRLYPEL